jgi:hypothetical protein
MKKELEIKKGFYRSAGDQYKWVQDGFDIRGIGINRIYFREPKLSVKVENKNYEMDTKEGLEFVNKYRSIILTRYGKIGVVSKSLLKEV